MFVVAKAISELLPAIDLKMMFYSHANETHFHKKGFAQALGLVSKVRVFGTQTWPFNVAIILE